MSAGGGEEADRRIARLLDTAGEALALAAREIQEAERFAARWRWVAVGLVAALQAALAAALSGYATARPQDIADPAAPQQLAPLGLLLRRARSRQYLNPPERLILPLAEEAAIQRLISLRNAAVHAATMAPSASPAVDAAAALRLIRHLVLTHPAFDPAPHTAVLVMAGEALVRLEQICTRLTAE
jgi:hypothetical protein